MKIIKWTILAIVCGLAIIFVSNTFFPSIPVSDINHIIHIGQSLGLGEHSLPIVALAGADAVELTLDDFLADTVILGNRKDPRNGLPFKTGQPCYIRRGYLYGNLHDSDKELSTFSFKDNTYGTRTGQKYPLYNWCVAFDDLVIKNQSKNNAAGAGQ